MSKLGILIAAGAGYVLGARAGRGRYEQIQQQASRVWSDPRVQKAKVQATDLAQEKANQAADLAKEKASQASDLAQEKASEVQEKIRERSNGDSSAASDAGASTESDAGSHEAHHPNPNDMPTHPATERLDD